MSKRIVVAYDGTREGRNGLFRFTETLPQTDADIHMLAVIRLPTGAFLAEGYIPEAVIDEEKQRYQEIVQEGMKLLTERGYRVTSHLEFGDPIEEIVRLARQLPADLVVVGHKRASSLAARWWGSSVGASLLEHSPCSILVAICD